VCARPISACEPGPGPVTIALVNRFAPPDPAPTATAAWELAVALADRLPGARFLLQASRARYGPEAGPAPCHPRIRIERIPSLYHGRALPGRLAASLLEGWWLARRAARAADLVISLTDPPLLPAWVGAACQRRHRRWIEWSMDLYPEFFAAAGLLSATGRPYRRLETWSRRHPPDLLLCLGPGQRQRRPPGIPSLVLPVGLPAEDTAGAALRTGGAADRLTLGYAGTVGDGHGVAALAALAEALDPARFRLVLAVRGGRAEELRRRLGERPGIEWRARLSWAELAALEVHVVSLAPAATGLCVPSKAVTAIGLGRPLLFLGDPGSDTWQTLGAAGWLVPWTTEAVPHRPALEQALAELADPGPRARRADAALALAERLRAERTETLRHLAARIADWFPAAATA
jgi:hypothetical protein